MDENEQRLEREGVPHWKRRRQNPQNVGQLLCQVRWAGRDGTQKGHVSPRQGGKAGRQDEEKAAELAAWWEQGGKKKGLRRKARQKGIVK